MLLEELRLAAGDAEKLLAWLARLVAVGTLYVLGLAGLRAWQRTAQDAGERFAPRALSIAWLLAALLIASALTAASLDLASAGPLYRWGTDIADWLGRRVVKVLGVSAFAFVGLALVRMVVNRITGGGAFSRRQVRIETLRGVLASVLRIAILLAAATTILGELGVNVTALLAGVSILGLAVSFGAQSLVKDVINGFFVLLEDQYGIGDVVRVNGAGGLTGGVEALSLRTTLLRDLDGTAHVIPNGTIQTVSVLSKDWARSVLDVEVSYDTPVDRAIDLVRRVAGELHEDPDWAGRFLEAPEVLGVEALGPSGATLRTLMKVQPKEQWAVAREFRRRIRNAFDASGLGVALPQLNLHLGPRARSLARDAAAGGPGVAGDDEDATLPAGNA